MQGMHRSRQLLTIASFALLAALSGIKPARAVTIGPPQQVGTVTNSTLKEISGLVVSRSNTNTLWVHNDSSDSARFFAMSPQGALLGTFPLAGVSVARDWEDIAIGPKAGGGNYLYLGDIGDNKAEYSSITVHRVVEPLSTAGATIPVGGQVSVTLKYPGGARDAESMFVDPLSGDLLILTKRLLVPELYSVAAAAFENTSQPVTMTRLGSFPEVPFWATAADISPDGRFILVRSSISGTGRLFERSIGESIAEALATPGVAFTLGNEAQGEAIGWAADGKSFFTTSEFSENSSAPIHSYAFSAPQPLLAGDYNNDLVVDTADFTVWRDHLNMSIALPNETATPNEVTVEDYDVWKQHFGLSSGGGSAVASLAVPEPASWLLVAMGMVAVLKRRKNRHFDRV